MIALGRGIRVTPILGLPEIQPGDDLAALLAPVLDEVPLPAALIVSSKVLSKAAGLIVRDRDREEVVAAQTQRVVAERASAAGATRVVEALAGPVMAAAGVDASNTGVDDVLLILPADPDAAAAQLRLAILRAAGRAPLDPLAVVVSDTAGRPWRDGLTDFALGSSGLTALMDHRGELDHDGRPMAVTVRAIADELCAAADLVRGKADGIPAAVVTGVPSSWFDAAAPGARTIVRTGASDWFALGHVEAVRAALGVVPGSPDSVSVGLRSVAPGEPLPLRVGRVVALALHGVEGAGADVEVGTDRAMVTVSAADDVTAGRLLARLEVAAFAEELIAQPCGHRGIQLVTTESAATPSR
ncbi:MAG: coenzyme F420-0:L-glutamate ligase [Phycicoccus sp.]|nr:coenzyme F420-0:L-glutamate ligase [Phycicoccus sp.]